MIDDKKFCEDPLTPDILKEPQLFDSQIEQIVYRPIDNRSPSVRTAKKRNSQKRLKFLFNKGQKHLQILQRIYYK